MKYVFKILSIFLLLPAISFSQKNELGFGLGAGTSEVVGPSQPLPISHYDFAHVGVNYYRTYLKDLLCLKSGLSFDYRYKPNDKRPYLRMPLGLDVRIGKKLEGVLGTGIIFYYLPGMKYEYIKKFQMGWELNSGLEFSLSENLDINIMVQKNFDLSAMDISLQYITQGDYRTIDWIVSDNLLKIGIKYTFLKK